MTFAGSFLLLLPATAAMGATLPAMERITAGWPGSASRSIATLYAANTLGAVVGVLATAFCLIPAIGLMRTTLLCATLNLLCGLAALLAFGDAAIAAPPRSNAQTRVQLFGSADDGRGNQEIARAYVVLGIEHILGGYDHQLFVLGLLFLVGFRRKLVWTVTAFTVAHSITLASAALGLLTLRSPPVEASIALSIVLVARDALEGRESLARRLPALVAFLFGLVHGLGFAGALREIGLPQKHLPMALFTFNIGVELGQLLIIGSALAIWKLLLARPQFTAARVPAIYATGAIASYWSIARITTIL